MYVTKQYKKKKIKHIMKLMIYPIIYFGSLYFSSRCLNISIVNIWLLDFKFSISQLLLLFVSIITVTTRDRNHSSILFDFHF